MNDDDSTLRPGGPGPAGGDGMSGAGPPPVPPAPLGPPTSGSSAMPGPAGTAADPGTGGPTVSPAALDRLAGLVYDRISERIGPPGDTGDEMPSVEEAVALRERAPELYDLWLRIAQERAATGNYVQRAPYEVPERLAQSGRPRALSALVVVLAFCGYLAWLGGPGPYIAGLIALFDLIAMLGLFFGLRPEHLSDPRRTARKRLPATASGPPRPTSAPDGPACPGPPGATARSG